MPKNDKEKQVPALRFEGFTDDWIKKKIKDVALVNSGRDYKHLKKGNVPVYGTGGFMTKVNKSLSKENAIGLGRKGTINKPQFLVAPFWTVDTLFYITVNKNITLSFFYGLTQTINWLRYDESSGVPSLSRKNINDVNVIIPELDEQIKIGKAIDLIDNLITLEQEKLEKITLIKCNLLQNIFPKDNEKIPVLRFANYDEKWENKKLTDILTKGSTTRVDDPDCYKRLTVKLNKKGIEEFTSTRKLANTRPFYQRYSGELIIGKQNYFNGSIAIIPDKFDGYVSSNAIMSFSALNDNMNFIYNYIGRDTYIQKRSHLANGTGQKELSEKDFMNFDINTPTIDEQNEIATLFNKLNKVILSTETKVNNYKKIKKYLLNNLFC